MAKYQSKSNQCFLENRRLFGFVITWDYWLFNIMTIFFTGLSNCASWMVVCSMFTRSFPYSYLSWERLYFQRSIIRVVLSWHIVLYYANVWVLYHKVIVHCVFVWQHLLCGCVYVQASGWNKLLSLTNTFTFNSLMFYKSLQFLFFFFLKISFFANYLHQKPDGAR